MTQARLDIVTHDLFDPFAEQVVVGLAMLGRVDRRIASDMLLSGGLRCIMQTLVDRPELMPDVGSRAFVDACYRVADVLDVDRDQVDRAFVEAVDAAETYADRRDVDRAFDMVLRRHRVAQANAELERVQLAVQRGDAGNVELGRAYLALDAAMRTGGVRVPPTTAELVSQVSEMQTRYSGRSHIGLDTPMLSRLSNRMSGWRGLTFLTAMPGIGKTTLLMQAGVDAVQTNPDACLLFLSLEMPPVTMTARLLSHLTGVSDRKLMLGPLDTVERDKLLQATQLLHDLGNRVRMFGMDDVGMLGGTTDPADALDDLVGIVQQAKQAAKVSRAFVVVDNFQRLQLRLKSPPSVRGSWDPLERDAYATTALMSAAIRLGIDDPVAVVAHTRKAGMERPDMDDVRGSGDIVYGGECLLTMYRPTPQEAAEAGLDDAKRDQAIWLDIVKGRDLMLRGREQLRFDYARSQFSEGWT